MVQNIHLSGGSLLGVSRGGPSVSEIVDSMEVLNQSFCIVISCRSFLLRITAIEMLLYSVNESPDVYVCILISGKWN